MSTLFVLVFLVSLIWFFVSKRKDKKTFGKTQKKTWFLLAVSLVSLILIGTNAPKTENASDKTQTKVASSSSAKSSSSKDSKELNAFNNWYKNEYGNEQEEAYKADNQEYFGSRYQIMQTALTGFIVENGELHALINNNRLKAEGLTQKEVANYAFNIVYGDFRGDLPHYKNLNSDGTLSKEVMSHPERYSTLE